MRGRWSRSFCRSRLAPAQHLEVCGIDEAIVGGYTWNVMLVLVVVVTIMGGWLAVGAMAIGT